MQKNKKWVLILLAASMAAALAGCNKGGGDGVIEGGSPQSGSDAGNQRADLVITSSGAMDDAAFEKNYGQYIKKKFPNYTITYIKKGSVGSGTSINELLVAGTKIDLIFESIGGMVDGLIRPGLGGDITELAKKANIDLNRFDPTLLDGMRAVAGGKLYGLPVNNMVMNLYYNKDIFDRFGVAYPKDGMTWDETLELAKKLNREDGGTQFLGLAVSSQHLLRMNPYSIGYVDEKNQQATYDNEKWKTILSTIYVGEADDPGYQKYMESNKGKIPYKDEFLKTKNLAMFGYFTDLPITYPEMDSVNWDVVALPAFKDMPKIGSQPYPIYWNVVSTSTQKDAAMEVIKYLTSDEFQMILSKRGELTSLTNPDIQKAYGSDYPRKDINWGAAFYNQLAKVPYKSLYDVITEKPLLDLTPQIASKKIDINTALRQAQEAANKAIAAEKSR
ncbi:ABC transporter substrate-binding protein [Paenibacillus sp. OAS669]|uniref:ABC transporter substrate-binding protein n=1 Tax=Paenibacillus sp. OAS669 TaxID=2663821 RepID=UPI0017898AE3|nr:extracellular solute-binding protein [Paenibacillus sp. OAS669]MBE1440908.1 multiple sugar transport system substrate-binding protein [Paenibacillus sp. OAS669]